MDHKVILFDMEAIPPLYWMFIIGFIAAGITLVLYYLAMAFKDLGGVLRKGADVLNEAKEISAEAKGLLEDSRYIITAVRGSVVKVSGLIEVVAEKILKPIELIADGLGFVTNLIPGKGKSDK